MKRGNRLSTKKVANIANSQNSIVHGHFLKSNRRKKLKDEVKNVPIFLKDNYEGEKGDMNIHENQDTTLVQKKQTHEPPFPYR